jgi:hypothetical protein
MELTIVAGRKFDGFSEGLASSRGRRADPH